jgi:glycosyltransferase involved in cell wall biosynthesis
MNKPPAYNIICFGFLPWSSMWKRNQSMMAEISKCDFINKVIFVNPLISIKSILHKNGSSDLTSNISANVFPLKATSKISVYTPVKFLPCRKYLMPLNKIETKIMLRFLRHLNSDMPYILFMNCPNIFSHYLLDELLKDAKLSFFDLSDDFVELGYGKETLEGFRNNITKYAQAADIVLTVNDHIREKYENINSNIHVIRNATNYDNFDRNEYKSIDVFEKMKNSKKPVIGYSGLANMSRIDSDLLDFLLEQRPDWQFVFIGPAKPDFIKRYSHYRNVHFFPPVNYQELPDYIHYFDVAIVPFKINDHTKGNDLLKLHDYLAMGKPVVSTDIGGADDLRDVIRIAGGPSDFRDAIEESLHNDTQQNVSKRKNVALTNSWHIRIKELEELIRDRLEI